MPTDDKKLREAVKALREEMGLTQVDFAKALGKAYPTVQRYEGQAPPPADVLVNLIRLAISQHRMDLVKTFRDGVFEELGADVAQVLLSEEYGREQAELIEHTPSPSWISRTASGLSDADQDLLKAVADILHASGPVADRARRALVRINEQAREPVMPSDADGLRRYFEDLGMHRVAAMADLIAARVGEQLQATAAVTEHKGKLNLIEFSKELTATEVEELAEVLQILRGPSSREEKSAAQALKVALNARRKTQQEAPGKSEKHRRAKTV